MRERSDCKEVEKARARIKQLKLACRELRDSNGLLKTRLRVLPVC
jgi:hypothetical protein